MKLIANDHNHIGVTGFSSIDHRIRNKLLINCDQYVVLEYIYRKVMIEKESPLKELRKELGMEHKRFMKAANEVKLMELLDDKFTPTAQVLKYFNYNEDFEYIWTVMKKNPGNKKEGRKMFDRAIKKTPVSQLKRCALNYASAKEGVESNYFMHVSSFLNPEYEKFNDYSKINKSNSPDSEQSRRGAW